MCKELDRDICTVKKNVINPELCDGRSDKGKFVRKHLCRIQP